MAELSLVVLLLIGLVVVVLGFAYLPLVTQYSNKESYSTATGCHYLPNPNMIAAVIAFKFELVG